ncbi:hypothetical protein D6C85_03555 [Aureobasidium pullulans]|uniref:Cora-domain-containing protein n=1 Tax=Aureobasidium pullulans TaxID=5580 RepID=A0A4S9ZPU3_AURPU|nr:hypothetical protein D6C85_03555 [Aureobasidium pullulans]TIA08058.1 hypothetical protein D6C81_09238 [Aureobasidium pullulans]
MSVPPSAQSGSSIKPVSFPDPKALVYDRGVCKWNIVGDSPLDVLKSKNEACIIFTQIGKFTKDANQHKELSKWFPPIPDMFWSETGVKHNGFFGCHTSTIPAPKLPIHTPDAATTRQETLNPIDASGQKSTSTSSTTLTSDNEATSPDPTGDPSTATTLSFDIQTTWTYFRLIVKILLTEPLADGTLPEGEIKYGWAEMAFLSFSNARRTVMVCFDMPNDVPEALLKTLPESLQDFDGPFGLHIPVLERLVKLYDKSIWGMAKTVRAFEKQREKDSKSKESKPDASSPQDSTKPDTPSVTSGAPGPVIPDPSDPQEARAQFQRLFAISRHITHSVETVQVAAEVLEQMKSECKLLLEVDLQGRLQKLKWLQSMLKGLSARSISNEKRLASEQTLLSNMISQRDSEETKKLSISSGEIAVATAVDSEAMKSIALVTMTFLPATFVTAFLGMNFFTVNSEKPEGHLKSSKDVWIFFAVAVPLTIVVLLLYRWWQIRRANRKGDIEKGGKEL